MTTASAVLFAVLPGGMALFFFATTVLAGSAQLVWPKHPRWASMGTGVMMMFGLLLTVFFRAVGFAKSTKLGLASFAARRSWAYH